MDVKRRGIVCVIGFIVVLLQLGNLVSANVVFHVQHKFHDQKTSLDAILHHDCHRHHHHHQRILSATELPLGGETNPIKAGLYFTKIQIGSPPKDYHVQVDTGGHILWVCCIECDTCPKKSYLGIPLTPYDPHASSTVKNVSCDDDFCKKLIDTHMGECKEGKCLYTVKYADDGSGSSGYFIKDTLQLPEASGENETKYVAGDMRFGCATKLSGRLESAELHAVDGMLGLGQSDSSLLSQFALEKKVKKTFSHCLSGSKGGGIFAIGEVVEPKVKTTKLLENKLKYGIEMNSIDVNGETLVNTKSVLDPGKEGVIIDSGTALAYFPPKIYKPLIEKILAAQPDKKTQQLGYLKCCEYTDNLDKGFPNVTLHFEDSLSMTLTPSQYFIEPVMVDWWCIGFVENTFESGEEEDKIGGKIILGDLVLADRLVTYDLENNVIGWVDHNCSATIKVKDEESGNVFEVQATNISSARCTSNSRMILGLLLFLVATFINWKN